MCMVFEVFKERAARASCQAGRILGKNRAQMKKESIADLLFCQVPNAKFTDFSGGCRRALVAAQIEKVKIRVTRGS